MISIQGLFDESLTDQAMRMEIHGARPASKVRVCLSAVDDQRIPWRSYALYAVSSDGQVRFAEQAPLQGSYEGIDAMGLFWSMQPQQGSPIGFSKLNLAPIEYRLEIESEEGELLLEREFQRRPAAAEVIVEKLAASQPDGLAGEFFFRKTERLSERPMALVFGGSGGGLEFARRASALLASHGVPSLALAYFAYPGRPPMLSGIELEYFEKALNWLKKRAGNSKASITVLGGSRGGELALILGSHYGDLIGRVIARVPSHLVWAGMDEKSNPAWLRQGEPLSHVKFHAVGEVMKEFERLRQGGGFISLTPLFMRALEHLGTSVQEAVIAVENIHGPVLLISGEDDQTWPSSYFSDQVVERMKAHGKSAQVTHLKFKDAGHAIPLPYYPTTIHDFTNPVDGTRLRNGGTDEGDARAAERSWVEILKWTGAEPISEAV